LDRDRVIESQIERESERERCRGDSGERFNYKSDYSWGIIYISKIFIE